MAIKIVIYAKNGISSSTFTDKADASGKMRHKRTASWWPCRCQNSVLKCILDSCWLVLQYTSTGNLLGSGPLETNNPTTAKASQNPILMDKTNNLHVEHITYSLIVASSITFLVISELFLESPSAAILDAPYRSTTSLYGCCST